MSERQDQTRTGTFKEFQDFTPAVARGERAVAPQKTFASKFMDPRLIHDESELF